MNIIRKFLKEKPEKRWALLWGTNTLFGVCKHIRYCDTEKEAEIFYIDIMNALPYAPTLVEPIIYDLQDPVQNKLFHIRLRLYE